jgi:hypothetical protein
MQIETIGLHRVAFGLSWVSLDGGIHEAIEGAFGFEDERPRFIYLTRGARRTSDATVGIAGLAKQESRRMVSAAQVVAGIGRDGFYALLLDDDTLWYCGVQNGSVIAATDVVAPRESGAEQVAALSAGLDLPVFADAQCADAFASAEVVDIHGVIAHTKVPPLYLRGANRTRVLVVAAIVAAGVMGFVLLGHPRGGQGDQASQEALRQQQIETFVMQAKGSIGVYTEDDAWPVTALRKVQRVAPPAIAGWEVSKVECLPSGCRIDYQHEGDGAFALSPLVELFGSDAVAMVRLGEQVTVTVPLETPIVPVSEGWLRTRLPSAVPFADWLGRVPDSMAGGKIAGTPLVNHLDQGAALGIRPVTVEQATVGADGYLDVSALANVIERGAVFGFRPARLVWIPSPSKPGWTISWSRVHG